MVAGFRRVIDEFDNRVLIGEIYLPIERLVAYYGENLMGLHLPFNFQLLSVAWTAPDVAALIERYETALPEGGWPNWVLSNHDRPRAAARVGQEQARVAAMLLLTLRGTPTLYYGDELGVGHVEIPPDRIQDPCGKRDPSLGRDPSRTPMQWDASPFAGFSTHAPWLPLTPDYETRNVEVMRHDETSILSLVRSLLHYRRRSAALKEGEWSLLSQDSSILAYKRGWGEYSIVVVLNFSGLPRIWSNPAGGETADRHLDTWRPSSRNGRNDREPARQRRPRDGNRARLQRHDSEQTYRSSVILANRRKPRKAGSRRTITDVAMLAR